MKLDLVAFLRNVLPSTVVKETHTSHEHVVTVSLPDRGQQRMLVCRVDHYHSERKWGWSMLGSRFYQCTEIVVHDPYSAQTEPVYQRTYDYLVSDEGARDMAIYMLESDYSWYYQSQPRTPAHDPE